MSRTTHLLEGKQVLLRQTVMDLLHWCCICMSASITAGCGSPNFYPHRYVTMEGATQEADLRKVHRIASDLGFERVHQYESGAVSNWGAREKETLLEQWEWRTRRSTWIAVSQGLVSHDFYVDFADNQTHGLDLVEDPCAKYLEFVAAIKVAFDGDPVKVIFGNEGCPNKK